MTQSNSSNQIQIHLTIRKDTEDLQIDFTYDTQNDNVDDVVKDLAEDVQLSPSQTNLLKGMIKKQIDTSISASKTTGSDENSDINKCDDESSGDEIDDQSYLDLLQKQKNQLNEMNLRHKNEQQQLIQKLTAKYNSANNGNLNSGNAAPIDDLLIF